MNVKLQSDGTAEGTTLVAEDGTALEGFARISWGPGTNGKAEGHVIFSGLEIVTPTAETPKDVDAGSKGSKTAKVPA